MFKAKHLTGIFMLSGFLGCHNLAAQDASVLPLEEIEVRASSEALTLDSAETARYPPGAGRGRHQSGADDGTGRASGHPG